MTIPTGAVAWADAMDPSDVVDYVIDLTDILETGEGIASYSLALPSEAVLYGLQLGPYPSTLEGSTIRVWLSVADANKSNSVFYAGVVAPVELTITTNSNPPRTRQRTLTVQIVEK